MTRKDYIAIAEALRFAREHETEAYLRLPEHQQSKLAVIGITTAAEYIANAMQDDNPRFDRDHFLKVVRGERELQSRPKRAGRGA